ncbi:hypothetical protein PLEOSDRAFT_165758 [Pleurotus ostreatus PC15]|uniref:Uncharacterized protein n=1 Tax=Pleurotus ostreatus (strain PC15) TaxID=1137138 RepID=A0A067P133_PLEO1|nr:hypothetical protein PLEOSDRAFT_165758 [Pleurotus ostreatus PC15]
MTQARVSIGKLFLFLSYHHSGSPSNKFDLSYSKCKNQGRGREMQGFRTQIEFQAQTVAEDVYGRGQTAFKFCRVSVLSEEAEKGVGRLIVYLSVFVDDGVKEEVMSLHCLLYLVIADTNEDTQRLYLCRYTILTILFYFPRLITRVSIAPLHAGIAVARNRRESPQLNSSYYPWFVFPLLLAHSLTHLDIRFVVAVLCFATATTTTEHARATRVANNVYRFSRTLGPADWKRFRIHEKQGTIGQTVGNEKTVFDTDHVVSSRSRHIEDTRRDLNKKENREAADIKYVKIFSAPDSASN